jgi:PAS domain S-box-containing protein
LFIKPGGQVRKEKMKKFSIIDNLKNISRGTHICQFYRNKEDLIEVLIPYFKTGLENNEFCMWVTSEPLGEKESQEAIRKDLPGFDRYLKKGQIEIVSHTEWYLKEGSFNPQRAINGWIDKLNQSLAKGYDGVRISGNTAWLEKKDWRNFTDYEGEINNTVGKYPMISVCTYFFDKCGIPETIDVVRNHQFSLIRRDGEWELIESKVEESLYKSERHYQALAEVLQVGILRTDAGGNCLYVNKRWCEITGFSPGENADNIWVGMLYPKDRERVLQERYRAARENLPFRSEYRLQRPDGRTTWISCKTLVERDENGEIVSYVEIITDITERKLAEERLKEQQQTLQIFGRNLRKLSGKILSIGEEEKKKLSINLHDEIGSMAVALNSSLSIAEEEIKDNNPQNAIKNISQTKNLLERNVEILKKIVTDLRPPDLDIVGLLDALKEYFSNISRQTKIEIDFSVDSGTRKLDENVAIVLYRLAQEALNNIIRHAEAKKVKVRLYFEENTLKFNIYDDGNGFNIKNFEKRKVSEMGIWGMRERVKSIGGIFSIKSKPKKGTKINITLPVEPLLPGID